MHKIIAYLRGCGLAISAVATVELAVGPAPLHAQGLPQTQPGSPPASLLARPEVVTIDSSFAIKRPTAIVEGAVSLGGLPTEYSAPVASVILMTGGNGLLALDSFGNVTTGAVANFVVRSANEFVRRGMHVMIADSAPANPSGHTSNASTETRLGAAHTAELQGFVNAANTLWGLPVWIVGTSRGSVSTVNAGGSNLTGLKGVVITSPVTAFPTNAAALTQFNALAAAITKPSLVVWHTQDGCGITTPAGSQALFNAIPAADKLAGPVSGGHSVLADLCGAYSEHGYAGIETSVVNMISLFIRQRSRPAGL